MPQALRASPPDRDHPAPPSGKPARDSLARIARPKMRVVRKGWNYREELHSQEEVAAGLAEDHPR